jgi:hypothetical protein
LAKSKINAKTTAATSVAPTTNIGREAIAIPQVASVEAISRSTTDEPISHRLYDCHDLLLKAKRGFLLT